MLKVDAIEICFRKIAVRIGLSRVSCPGAIKHAVELVLLPVNLIFVIYRGNSLLICIDKNKFLNRINLVDSAACRPFSVIDVIDAVNKQQKRKVLDQMVSSWCR